MWFVSSIKMVLELALLTMAGQWLAGRLAGPGRESNAVYQVLASLTRPFWRLARRVAPRGLADRHVVLLVVVLLLAAWCAAALVKMQMCRQMGLAGCR